jgi:hypothetical protein
MESAELSKEKRVRHCYPRKEVYHRWIHSPMYVYHSRNHAISGKYNFLVVGDIGRNNDFDNIASSWYLLSRTVAIIDRERKRIIINNSFREHAWCVKNALPDDYEKFYTDEDIPSMDILNDDNLLYKTHATYLVKQFTDYYLKPQYHALYGHIKKVYSSVSKIFTTYVRQYKDIEDFVKKYKIKKYAWYKESLVKNYDIRYVARDYSITKHNIDLPSLMKIINRTVFTPKEREILKFKYFYSMYCYGYGIPYNDIIKNYYKEFTSEEASKYFNKRCIYFNPDWIKEYPISFVELVQTVHKANNNRHLAYINECKEKSKKNYEEALAKLKELDKEEYSVNDWREGKIKRARYVEYEEYFNYGREKGWRTVKLSSSRINGFQNIQLKLKNGIITTSNHATVLLDDAIKLYRFFEVCINKEPDNIKFDFNGKNIKVGIYTLRHFIYKGKTTNAGDNLGYKEWVIQIGCHSIWFDDFLDFVKYYKLENEFNIKNIG